MKNRTVEFKNGLKIKISIEIANALRDSVCKQGGANELQCFSEDGVGTKLIIRLSEVVAIYDHESII